MLTDNRIQPTTRTTAQNWRLALLMTGVTALCAQLSAPLPFTPVPVTLQVFAVLLSGLWLGKRWGAVAQLQYVALGLLGAPVFALGRSGLGVLFWPNVTGGYLLSYPLAAFLIGWLVERGHADESAPRQLRRSLLACAAGLGVIYGLGCTWLALLSRPMLSPFAAFLAGAGWFLVWDGVKALAAIAVAQKLASGEHSKNRLP